MNQEELHEKMLQDIEDSKNRIKVLMYNDMLDDGYPTEYALEIVRVWHWSDMEGWFDFIKSIWWSADWGWKEKDEQHEIFPEREVHRYYISTGGWSGNESIIEAMQENSMMWTLSWVQSRRGGHYIFELRDVE